VPSEDSCLGFLNELLVGSSEVASRCRRVSHSKKFSREDASAAVLRAHNEGRRGMTASGGLQSDARRAVYEEDVVTYADDDTAEEWGDPQNYSATAVGLVSRVAGSDDEWSSDEEPEEVRIELGWRVASVYRDNPPNAPRGPRCARRRRRCA
jgi:hypothetical protein